MKRICIAVATGASVLLLATTQGLADAPDPVPGLYRQSYQAESAGDFAAALNAQDTIRLKEGGAYVAWLRTGWLRHLSGDHDSAIQAYQHATKLAPRSVEARLGLTLPLLAKQRFSELERVCLEILRLDPGNATARARLAHAQYSLGRHADAQRQYELLVLAYPGDPDHHSGLGWALLRQGRRDRARKVFEGLLHFAPDHPSARAGLAKIDASGK